MSQRWCRADHVARLLAALIAPFTGVGAVVERHEVNRQPGADAWAVLREANLVRARISADLS